MDAAHQTVAMTTSMPKTLQCLEVWGGNHSVDTSVAMSGLDAWIYSRPHDGADAGGDVYYLSSCAAGEVTRMLVADVAGHGTRVSETAAHLRNLMRRFIVFHDQRRLVRSINRRFARVTRDGNFATAVVLTFEASQSHLVLSNAGHPSPLVYRGATRQWELMSDHHVQSALGLPLGIEDAHDYQQVDLHLSVGDLVLCYTDSLSESLDADGSCLGPHGLLEVARQLPPTEPDRLIDLLTGKLTELNPRNLAGDDVTILLVRPNGRHYDVPLHEKLTAPFRVTREVAASFLPLRRIVTSERV